MATLKLWHGTNNESWREATSALADQHGWDDTQHQEAADLLRQLTEARLCDGGHKVETARQQSVGAFAINQSRTHDALFADALDTAWLRLKAEIAEWGAGEQAKLVRVTYWAGTTQQTTDVSSYKEAMRVIDKYHRNAFSPTFEEIATGRELFDDGTGLCYEDRSAYVV